MNLEELTYKIKDKLYRFSLRITGDMAESEDVVQEVFLKVWDKRQDMGHILNPEAWCMTLTKNLSLDKLRSKHRIKEDISNSLYITDSEPTPYKETEINDTMSRIRYFMEMLPEKQKMVMQLRDIEGMAYEEIAVALEMPLAQVKVYLHRARHSIREKLLNENI